MEKPELRRKTITVRQTAKVMGISYNLALEACKRGDLPHLRIGRRIVVPIDALDRFLAAAADK